MFHGKDAGWKKLGGLAGAALSLVALAGCVTLSGPPFTSDPPPTSSRLAHTSEPAPTPDMRIPVETVADNREVPLVPLPPVPGIPQPPPAGAIKPVVAQVQVSAPTAPPAVPAPLLVDTPPASPPAAESAPVAGTPPASQHTAAQLVEQAAARYAGIDSYIARLTRREQVKKNKDMPEEILLFKFRKKPWSVHLKWLGPVGHGREVVYVKDQYENKIHSLLAAGDAPFMPAGKRMDLAVDSLLVRSASRHSITEAGIGSCIDFLREIVAAQQRGDRSKGTLTVLPPQNRPEYPRPVEALEQTIPPGREPQLPQGGRRLLCFDPQWQMPLLVITHDHQGKEVEYYRYDRMVAPVHLDDDDFNPDKLWPPKTNNPTAPK